MALWRTDASTRRVVGDVDLAEAARLCARDPVASVLAAARIESAIAHGSRYGGRNMWGVQRGGELVAVCWAGANLVPICDADDAEVLDVLADVALTQGRRCSSIVGPADAVLGLWERVERVWGPAREVRADQPSMVIDSAPAVAPDPSVRRGISADLPVLVPACVQMFLEEVGYSPLEGSPGSYETRVRNLVLDGCSFLRTDVVDGRPEVVFKAELGAVSSAVAQVQGVWVPTERRGHGIGTAGMAAVVEASLGHVAPQVSLYVNHYNDAALAMYRKVGFRQVGVYATVLF